MACYSDLNDSQPVSQCPTHRLSSSEKIWDWSVSLTSQLQSIETEMLAEKENLAGLAGA